MEFSLESESPDQPLKTYPFWGVAVKLTDVPASKLPSAVSTLPPSVADIVRVNFSITTGSGVTWIGVTSSSSPPPQEISIKPNNKNISFFTISNLLIQYTKLFSKQLMN